MRQKFTKGVKLLSGLKLEVYTALEVLGGKRYSSDPELVGLSGVYPDEISRTMANLYMAGYIQREQIPSSEGVKHAVWWYWVPEGQKLEDVYADKANLSVKSFRDRYGPTPDKNKPKVKNTAPTPLMEAARIADKANAERHDGLLFEVGDLVQFILPNLFENVVRVLLLKGPTVVYEEHNGYIDVAHIDEVKPVTDEALSEFCSRNDWMRDFKEQFGYPLSYEAVRQLYIDLKDGKIKAPK